MLRHTYSWAALLLLAVASSSRAQDLKLPAELKGELGDFLTVPAVTTGKTVRWASLDKGLKLVPSELLKDTKTAIVFGLRPGRYRLWAWTVVNGEPTDRVECIVTLAGDVPIPGPEPPGPGPVPPVPPAPVPGPPADPYKRAIWEAWQTETPADKAKVASLVAVYQVAAEGAASTNAETVHEYAQRMGKLRQERIGNALPSLRKVVGLEADKILPTDVSVTFSPAFREAWRAYYTRTASAVQEVCQSFDPKPDPRPDTAPINAPGLHVLIVYEQMNITPAIKNITDGVPARELLEAKCVKEPDGRKAYRIWDKDLPVDRDYPKWAAALQRAKAAKGNALAWLIVSNPGRPNYEGPLPSTFAELQAIITKSE